MAAGHSFLRPQELRRALRERSIAETQIDRALAVLAGLDRAGVIRSVAWEEAAHVAVYLHVKRDRNWIPSWTWTLIERGHPAARALWWHEVQELEAYRLLGVPNPLRLSRRGTTYWQAHAWASWQEARYWQAWAAAEGEGIPAEAFLLAHLVRNEQGEIPRLVSELETSWGIGTGPASIMVLRRAEQFYRDKELTGQDIERWLSR
ncbi:MAG: hypothetical protein HY690_06465 [Chloroflexi bacterium]|nr:hypothetical protein [Chloroflexota bacterium]